MNELSLFDSLAARAGDPDTSRDAAQSIASGRGAECLRILGVVLEVERTEPGKGATAHEVVMNLAYSGHAPQQNCVARRLTDLHKAGLVEDRGDRRPGGSGRQLIVWYVTEQGRVAA